MISWPWARLGGDVDDVVRLDRAGEVPGGADVGAQGERNRVAAQGFDFAALQGAGGDDRTLDATVEDHLPDGLPAGVFPAGGRDQEWRVAADDSGPLARVSGLAARRVTGVGVQQLLPQVNFTAGGVVRGADQVPLAGDEGMPEGEFLQAPGAVSELQDEAVCGIGPEGEAATG